MALVARSLYVCLVLPAVSVLARPSVVWRSVETKSVLRDSQRLLSRAGRRERVVRLNGRVDCSGIGHLFLGEHVHIKGNALLRAEAGLAIGDNAHISRNVTI
jgi:acetyltransferase-like isoleucine patch superfamily enzyme